MSRHFILLSLGHEPGYKASQCWAPTATAWPQTKPGWLALLQVKELLAERPVV
jgi:hypothetical protein